MPLTSTEFLDKYSIGKSVNIQDAYQYTISSLTARDRALGLKSGTSFRDLYSNLWKYGENGVLEKVPSEEISDKNMVENMLRGTIYVLPAMNADGEPDLTKTYTITMVKVDDKYYGQLMDGAQAKEAYENKPVNAPSFIDRVVDFFCRLVGKRSTVCALWDTANEMSNNIKKFAEQEVRNELLDRDYNRKEKILTDDEKSKRTQKAREVTKARLGQVDLDKFDESLTEWYLAMYTNSHDLFPAFIPDYYEVEMSKYDQQALDFAGKHINYNNGHYYRQRDFDGSHKAFDVRINTVTTLAFALTADLDLSAEDVFNFLSGTVTTTTEGLRERMEAEMAKLNDPETRNSSAMIKNIKKGTARMCELLEKQPSLNNAISYQLGRTIQRNVIAFGSESSKQDVVVNLELPPLAKQIVKLQDEVISSYNSTILQGFALHKNWGDWMTRMQGFGLLPINAVGHTNAAFLEKLSDQRPKDRMQFLKDKLYVFEEMNENLRNFVYQRAREKSCTWMDSPQDLKKALNGGMVKEYQESVIQSLRETGKMPVFRDPIDDLKDEKGVVVDDTDSQIFVYEEMKKAQSKGL